MRRQTSKPNKIMVGGVPIIVAEYPDGQHTLLTPKTDLTESDLTEALAEHYPNHRANVQDEGSRWRVDLFPNNELTADKQFFMLPVPIALRYEVLAALGQRATALESEANSQDLSEPSRKYQDQLGMSAIRLRGLAATLLDKTEDAL